MAGHRRGRGIAGRWLNICRIAMPARWLPSDNRLGSCNAACGRYRRRHQNGSLGRGAGHPSAELSLGSRGVMNRQTLDAIESTKSRNWSES